MEINLFKKDYSFGVNSENYIIDELSKKFGLLKKALKKNSMYDFFNDDVFIELKTRRSNKDKYNTTMIGKNKFDWAELNTNKKIYFVFGFTDGIYYWEYNKEDLINKKIKFDLGGRWDRGVEEIKVYGYIPNDLLIKLE